MLTREFEWGEVSELVGDLDRAKIYATQCDEKPVWSLGKAQLEEKFPADAIEAFIHADDPSEYVKVCEAYASFLRSIC